MTRLSYISSPTPCDARSVTEVVPDQKSSRIAVAMQALYKECVAQIIKDDHISFHVIMMPGMTGHHFTYAVKEELELAQDCANLLDVDIYENDCLVILGHDILTHDISEDAMMRIVLSDIALHMRRLFPVVGKECGHYGASLGWAAIASVIAAAHPIVRTFNGVGDDDLEVIGICEELARRASQAIREGYHSKGPKLDISARRAIDDVISYVCDLSFETNGGYLQLPATMAEIHSIAREHYYEAANELGFSMSRAD